MKDLIFENSDLEQGRLRVDGSGRDATRPAGDHGAKNIRWNTEPSRVFRTQAVHQIEKNIGIAFEGILDLSTGELKRVAGRAGQDVIEIAAQEFELFVTEKHGCSGSSLLDGNDRERKAEAELAIDPDLDRIDAVFLKLEPAKNVHVGRVSIQGRKRKLHLALGYRVFIIGIEDQRVLIELSDSAAPSSPQAKLEKPDRHHRGGNDSHNADEGLLPAGLLADVLAENAGLEVRKNFLGHWSITQQFVRYAQDIFPRDDCPSDGQFLHADFSICGLPKAPLRSPPQ